MFLGVMGWLAPILLIPHDWPGGRFLQGIGVVVWCGVALCVFGRPSPVAEQVERSRR